MITGVDLMIFVDTIMLYRMIKSMSTSIVYKP